MNYCVLDLETYGYKTYKRFCNPLDPNHRVIAIAGRLSNREGVFCLYELDKDIINSHFDFIFNKLRKDDIKLLIGQNFKFDMLWFWSNPEFKLWLKEGGQVWDTLLVEYLLRGQQGISHSKDPKSGLSLDALSQKYGGTQKDDGVKNIFKNGSTVLDIPEEQLVEYAQHDVLNTEIVYLGQVEKVKKCRMEGIVAVYNKHLLAVTEIEYNGMYVDRSRMELAEQDELQHINRLKSELQQLINDYNLWPGELIKFNSASNDHLSVLIFGGNLKIEGRRPSVDKEGNQIIFKSGQKIGQLKTHKVQVPIMIQGLEEKYDRAWENKKGFVCTDRVILDTVKHNSKNQFTKDIINIILNIKTREKRLGTYLTGFLPLIHPDGCLHSEYNTAKTETGRLSSETPNLQNLPITITPLFVSRFGDKGCLIEVDFSQLEVIVQAYVSQSYNMIKDIENKIDFHCLRLSYVENMEYDEVKKLCDIDPVWAKKRKAAKTISFQKAYGAHVNKIADSTGLSVEQVEAVFNKENERYPEIVEFYRTITEHLSRNKKMTNKTLEVRTVPGVYKEIPGQYQNAARWQSITGKIYTFWERATMTRRGIWKYWHSPTVQDYPIQGMAADIVAAQVGRIWEFLIYHKEKCLLVNEIHDSIILDCKKEHEEFIITQVAHIMEDVQGSFIEHFNLPFNVPIKVDVKVYDKWKVEK